MSPSAYSSPFAPFTPPTPRTSTPRIAAAEDDASSASVGACRVTTTRLRARRTCSMWASRSYSPARIWLTGSGTSESASHRLQIAFFPSSCTSLSSSADARMSAQSSGGSSLITGLPSSKSTTSDGPIASYRSSQKPPHTAAGRRCPRASPPVSATLTTAKNLTRPCSWSATFPENKSVPVPYEGTRQRSKWPAPAAARAVSGSAPSATAEGLASLGRSLAPTHFFMMRSHTRRRRSALRVSTKRPLALGIGHMSKTEFAGCEPRTLDQSLSPRPASVSIE
mmetsp:Transcript_66271/g.182986  ORF Transcript_66271/g.182986 Transcript_66271/m.182986 type:complete len:281 (-) Transcript_66271:691-1533(-)